MQLTFAPRKARVEGRVVVNGVEVKCEEGAELYDLVDVEDGQHHVQRFPAHALANGRAAEANEGRGEGVDLPHIGTHEGAFKVSASCTCLPSAGCTCLQAKEREGVWLWWSRQSDCSVQQRGWLTQV